MRHFAEISKSFASKVLSEVFFSRRRELGSAQKFSNLIWPLKLRFSKCCQCAVNIQNSTVLQPVDSWKKENCWYQSPRPSPNVDKNEMCKQLGEIIEEFGKVLWLKLHPRIYPYKSSTPVKSQYQRQFHLNLPLQIPTSPSHEQSPWHSTAS